MEKQENDLIEKFVVEFPYPTYEEIMEYLSDTIDLECEYGEFNHKQYTKIRQIKHLLLKWERKYIKWVDYKHCPQIIQY